MIQMWLIHGVAAVADGIYSVCACVCVKKNDKWSLNLSFIRQRNKRIHSLQVNRRIYDQRKYLVSDWWKEINLWDASHMFIKLYVLQSKFQRKISVKLQFLGVFFIRSTTKMTTANPSCTVVFLIRMYQNSWGNICLKVGIYRCGEENKIHHQHEHSAKAAAGKFSIVKYTLAGCCVCQLALLDWKHIWCIKKHIFLLSKRYFLHFWYQCECIMGIPKESLSVPETYHNTIKK